ncbi:hypothetical protein [Paenibacillus marinisediminis]
MLLECDEIKLLIVNLDEVATELDDALSDLIDYKDCVFILSDKSRVDKLQEEIDDFTYTSPSGWFSFSNSQTISKILRENDIEPYEAVYITGDPQEAYNHLGVSTVLIVDEDTVIDKNNLPDHHAKSIKSLIKCLKGKSYGYFGELYADGIGGNGGYFLSKLNNDLIPSVDTDLVIFGRYYVSHDSRAYIHPLTHLTLQMKNGYPKQIESVARLFSSSINFLHEQELLEEGTITVVPPKPNKRNVLMEVINKSKDLGEESLIAEFKVTELLKLKQNYTPQKEVGNYTNRFLNVKNKFKTNKTVSGHVILVDDIITSGATALECAKILYEAGAEKVTVLAFGASQNKSEALMLEHLLCNSCEDGEYKIRFGSSAFYGCTNWPDCKSTIKYESGRRRYISSRKLQQNSFEFDDDVF